MNKPHTDGPPSGDSEPLDLAAAYAELQNLILDGPDVTSFLQDLAVLAAAIVPGTHCGITLRRDGQIASVAGNDEIARRMDEIQYLQGRGPCLEALGTSRRVDVPQYRRRGTVGCLPGPRLANGVQSAVSLPIVIDGASVGALNLFGASVGAFDESAVARAQDFTDQAATAITILLRQASRITLDAQLRDALVSRAVIDQALGILMHAHKIGSHEAFEILRHASQTRNRKLSVIAAEIIETMTGHPPEPPRPLTDRS
jgi:GAF domain-containing protein